MQAETLLKQVANMSLVPHPQSQSSRAYAEFKGLSGEGHNYLAFRHALRNLDEPEQRISFARTVICLLRDKNYESAWEFARVSAEFSTEPLNRLIITQRVGQLMEKDKAKALSFAKIWVKNKKIKLAIASALHTDLLANKKYQPAAILWDEYNLGPKRHNLAAFEMVRLQIESVRSYALNEPKEKNDKLKTLEEIKDKLEDAIEFGRLYPRAVKRKDVVKAVKLHAKAQQMIFSIEHGLANHIPHTFGPSKLPN
ncbi:MAG: hypothetical protein ACREBF_00565 [Candidatus Micrarchaeales archaeon]